MTPIEKSRNIGLAIHKDDKRADGRDYYEHLDLVYRITKYWNSIEPIQLATYVHDAVEDHPDKITLQYIEEQLGYEVARIVEVLNNTKYNTYLEYLLELKDKAFRFPYNVALEVKKADMIANYYDTIYYPSKNAHQMKHLKNKSEMAFYILFRQNIWERNELTLIIKGKI